jgi:hypothetical protein
VRRLRPELLDDSPPEESVRSLADLVRINRYLGGHEVLRKTFALLFKPGERFSMLDVGSASGDAGYVIRDQFPAARIVSLDYRVHHLEHAAPPRVAADAFHLPVRSAAFDVVHCSLFLHHFTDRQIVDLLRGFSRAARRYVVVNDLERHLLAERFIPATRWLFGWHPITVHDASLSVAAAFKPAELRRLAELAGLEQVQVRAYRPSFRIALVACPPTGG